MPRVILEYRKDSLTVHQIMALRQSLKQSAAIYLSTKGLSLTEKDITVKFAEAGEYDDLTHDVILHVPVSPQGNRRQECVMIASNFLWSLKSDFAKLPHNNDDDPPLPASIGVLLTFTDSTWVEWIAPA